MQGAEPVPCSASPRTPWWIFSGQWEFSYPSHLGSQVSLFRSLAKRNAICGKAQMASWEFCLPLLLIIKLAGLCAGTARCVCWVSSGAGPWELKVVWVPQTSTGLRRPAAQAGPWHVAFCAELHVCLDCWGWRGTPSSWGDIKGIWFMIGNSLKQVMKMLPPGVCLLSYFLAHESGAEPPQLKACGHTPSSLPLWILL